MENWCSSDDKSQFTESTLVAEFSKPKEFHLNRLNSTEFN